MIKKLLFISLLFSFVNVAFAMPTYVGIHIQNLTDDPATSSCIGVSGYGDQGRIRALSSYPEHGMPLYFELSYVSNSSIIWAGNSTVNVDYHRGETIYLPQEFTLTPGVDYKIFMDVDMVKIYFRALPTTTWRATDRTPDNIYWTSGLRFTSISGDDRIFPNSCTGSIVSGTTVRPTFIAVNPSIAANLSCTVSTCGNVGNEGFLVRDGSSHLSTTYRNLHLPNVGNFEFFFTY